jgi:DNA-binding transcriptional regulator YiaG
MARPTDPLSQLQVEKRAQWLRSEESGWTESLSLAVAMAALKSWQWSHYLESGGERGPLAGPFPKLPEEPGSWVLVGASETEGKALEGATPTPSISGYGAASPAEGPRRLYLLRGDQCLVDGQADGCEAPDTEQLAMAMELASLLRERHLQLLLRPTFYKEVAAWIGNLLKAPRPKTYSPPESDRTATWLDPKNWEVLGTEVPMDGVSALVGAPGSPWPGDLWRVPAAPLGIPSNEALHRHGISAEELALCAACWHFGRVIYRKLLDPRPNDLGQSGLEQLRHLRQLLEELEVVSPRGLPVRSVAGKPVTSMASHEVASLGLRAFPRADKWDEEDGRGRFLHERQGRRWLVTMATGAGEELAFKSLAQCRKLLTYKNAGLEITSLHALLCCYVMQCREPGSRFVVSADDLLKDLGLEARRYGGATRSDLLKEIGKWASLLGLAQCEGWSRPKDREMVSMELGPMWSISIHANGQLQLLEQGDPRPDTLTDLSLTVTPGTWAEIPQWSNREGGHLLYAPIATEILQLGRHRRELAFRLGIHLALAFRERTPWKGGIARNVRVADLLGDVLPQGELERARGNREEGRRLRERWSAALATLRDAVGFRFEFPDCPPWLIPPDFPGHDGSPAPHGALEMLLNSRVEIHWPEKVVEARHRKPLAQIQERETQKLIRQTQARLLNQRPTDNAAQLRTAREATGRAMREIAPLLGISQAQLSKLETGKKPLPETELRRCLALLETLKRRKA